MNYLDLTHATLDNKHLSKLIEDLPINCFFNKVLCGAGGTHLSLSNKNPYIILVPTTELILSKKENTYPTEVMYVYGDVKIEEIIKYIDSNGNKIMSTYHSLHKVIKAFEASLKSTKDFQLLVDEAHMLTEGDDKDFMHNEINYILQSYSMFKSYCFMTATPFPRECFPDQIKDINYITAYWNPNVITVTKINAQHIPNKFIDYVTKIALDHLSGAKVGNAYFFYNSVEAITQVCYRLLKAKLCTEEDIRIIAADRNNNYIHKYVSKDLHIQSVVSEKKKLNFLTSKAFEGCDLYDEDGVVYICADARKRHSRLEIHTKLPQIVNRIRDSKYNNQVNLLYTKSFISTNISKEEFINETNEAICKAEYQASQIRAMDDITKELLNTDMLETSEYFTKDLEGNYIVNRNAGKRAIALWEAANQTYSIFKSEKEIDKVEVRSPLIELMFNGGNTTEFKLPSGVEKIKLGGKAANFKSMALDYIKAISNKDSEQIDFIENYDEIFKLAHLAFKSNLESNLKAISFQRSKIESRINTQIKCNSENIKLALFETFKAKDIVTKSKIREIIDSLYTQEGIDKKARATDIKDYFVVVETTDKNKDGAFRIIRRK